MTVTTENHGILFMKDCGARSLNDWLPFPLTTMTLSSETQPGSTGRLILLVGPQMIVCLTVMLGECKIQIVGSTELGNYVDLRILIETA